LFAQKYQIFSKIDLFFRKIGPSGGAVAPLCPLWVHPCELPLWGGGYLVITIKKENLGLIDREPIPATSESICLPDI